MDEKISPEAQQMFLQMQQMQKQLQSIDMQKQNIAYQKMEIEKALEEVKKCDEKEEMFKIVGPIMIKSDKKKLENELSDTTKNIENNLKLLEETEKKIGEKLTSNQEKLQEMLSDKKPVGQAG